MTNDVQIKEHHQIPTIIRKTKDNLTTLRSNIIHKYGKLVYTLLYLEEQLTEKQIIEIIREVVDRTCEQINSPLLHNTRVCLFSSLKNIYTEIKFTKPITIHPLKPDKEDKNKYILFLRKIPFERRLIYLLKIKENIPYRDLEHITARYRDEIARILTETREQIRNFLNESNLLPYAQPEPLCPITYKYLSPYLDLELNILHIKEMETHLLQCDKCLEILANHQYVQKEIEKLNVPILIDFSTFINDPSDNLCAYTPHQPSVSQQKTYLPNHPHPQQAPSILKKVIKYFKRLLNHKSQ